MSSSPCKRSRGYRVVVIGKSYGCGWGDHHCRPSGGWGWKWAPLSSTLGLGTATITEGSSSSSTLRAARDVNSIECNPKTVGIASKSVNGGQGRKFYLLGVNMRRSSIPNDGNALASVVTRCMYCKTCRSKLRRHEIKRSSLGMDERLVANVEGE